MKKPARSTKERLFDKAVELFAANGYENVSINDIAAAAGIKGASLYNHYPNKETLLSEIYDFLPTIILTTPPLLSRRRRFCVTARQRK